ncbi:hypothetical protein D3C80_2113310 [compost metagenome]
MAVSVAALTTRKLSSAVLLSMVVSASMMVCAQLPGLSNRRGPKLAARNARRRGEGRSADIGIPVACPVRKVACRCHKAG